MPEKYIETKSASENRSEQNLSIHTHARARTQKHTHTHTHGERVPHSLSVWYGISTYIDSEIHSLFPRPPLTTTRIRTHTHTHTTHVHTHTHTHTHTAHSYTCQLHTQCIYYTTFSMLPKVPRLSIVFCFQGSFFLLYCRILIFLGS